MITYQQEPFHPFVEEAKQLFQMHYDEIADHTMELDYDIAHYDRLDKGGVLLVHTMRNNGILVGYSLWIVSRHPRYRGTVVAKNDILYTRRDQRFGLAGYKFLKWCVQDLAKRGVNRALFHVKPHLDFSKLLQRMGGVHFETTYSLTLEN